MDGRNRSDDLRRSELESQIYYRLVERLSSSERRHRELVEGIRDAVFQCDPDGRLEYVNPAWAQLLGYEGATCVGRPLADFVVPAERDQLAAYLAAGATAAGEFQFVHREGKTVFADVSLRRIPDEGWVGSLHDETARREAHGTLERAKNELEAADRLKTEFLANVSHEIRTPMTAVLGFSSFLAESDLSTGEREEYVRRIQDNGRRLLQVINDTLDMSQLIADRLRIVPERCDLPALLADLEALYAPCARAGGLAWKLTVGTDLPPACTTDGARLRQILGKLLGNAVKFTSEGEVELLAQLGPKGSSLEFAVRDTGPGLTPEDLEHLFRPFRQADGSATRAFGGVGLGLSVAKGLAERLGGGLEVHTEQRVGSRFTVRIPFVPANVATPTARQDAEMTVPPMRVLLAEDTPDMARLVERFLKRLGVDVVVAGDGSQAIERAMDAMRADMPFDLVLMDMQMPVLDGYRATAELRSRGFGGPIVALTAHALPEDRARCLAVGCDDHVAKPVGKPDLQLLLRRYAPVTGGA